MNDSCPVAASGHYEHTRNDHKLLCLCMLL